MYRLFARRSAALRWLLLCAVLALAGCSASRPPIPALTDEATATSGPTPEASDTSSDTVLIMLTGFTLDESLKIERFLNEYCSREEEELPKPIKNVRRMLYEEYPLCGTAEVSDLERGLKAKLKEYGVEGVVSASENNILRVDKRYEVPIFSPLPVHRQVKREFVGQTLELLKKCEETYELEEFRNDSWWNYTEASAYRKTTVDAGKGRQCSVAFPTKVFGMHGIISSECFQHACQTRSGHVENAIPSPDGFTCPAGFTYVGNLFLMCKDNFTPHFQFVQGFRFGPQSKAEALGSINFCWHSTGIGNSNCLDMRDPCC